MADALCGPSNALQTFQKQALVDRTLQQDRLISRQSPNQVRQLYSSVGLTILIKVYSRVSAPKIHAPASSTPNSKPFKLLNPCIYHNPISQHIASQIQGFKTPVPALLDR